MTCSNDPGIERGKPAPDLFLAARATFKGNPEAKECLVFEDATKGVQAATAAGMPSIWIPGTCSMMDTLNVFDDMLNWQLDPNLKALHQDSTDFHPLETLSSMEEFDPSRYGLPAWDSK